MSSVDDKALVRLGMGLDPHADVYRCGNKVLRAIHPQYESFYSELLAHRVTQDLVAEGMLIPVARSTVAIKGHGLVLEHPLLRPVTYPFEWTPSMLREAAKLLLKLNLRLMEHGYCTQDGHAWNVLFQRTTPKFIDFTSIIKTPSNGKWEGGEEFQACCLNVLKLIEKGYPTVARRLLLEVRACPDQALTNAVMFNPTRHWQSKGLAGDFLKLRDLAVYFGSKVANRIKHQLGNSKPAAELMRESLEQIERMDLTPTPEMWADYYSGGVKNLPLYSGKKEQLEALRKATPKHEAVTSLLSKLKPGTVLDIACNRGVYSQIAALNGASAIGVDTNELVLDQMYGDSVQMGTDALPLYCNITTPAEAIGFTQKPFALVHERLRSECVLCLALVHHLVFKPPRLKFDHIAHILASFTERYLIVEFVPIEDGAVQESLQKRTPEFRARFGWYSLENFKAALAKHFELVESHDSFPKPRVILLCRKKDSGAGAMPSKS